MSMNYRIYTPSIKSLITLGSSFLFLIYSCGDSSYRRTDKGLQYKMIVSRNARRPVLGDRMILHLSYENSAGREIYNSSVIGDDFVLELSPPSFAGGIEEGFSMMGEGDSAHFLLPADSVFAKTFNQPLPDGIKSGEQLLFKVKMKSVIPAQELQGRMKALTDSVALADAIAINTFLKRNNITAHPVREGVYFIVFEEGKGEKPRAGDSVEVSYTATFLDGSVFDASSGNGSNLRYVLGDGLRLKAWDEAIASLRPGGVCRLVLSSAEAFGTRGFGPVPPNTPVVYNINLLRVNANSGTKISAGK